MNACVKIQPKIVKPMPTLEAHTLYSGSITAIDLNSHTWTIDHRIQAHCADSFLVKPNVGDIVSFIQRNDRYFIIQILQQSAVDTLNLISTKPILMSAPVIKIHAKDLLECLSLNRLSLICQHGALSMACTLIVSAEHMIQTVGQLALNARGLLKLNGKQQIITADEDVRIDGKRINMG